MKRIDELQSIRAHFEGAASDVFTKICRSILDGIDREIYDPVMTSIIEYGTTMQRAGEAHGVIGERIGVDYTHSIPTGANENDSEN